MGCSKHLYDAQFVPFCQALYTFRPFHFLSWQRDGLQVSRHLQFTIFWHLSLSSLYQIYCVWPFHQFSTFLTFLVDILVPLFTAIYPIFSLKFPINSSSDSVMYCYFTMLSQPVAICIIADLSFVWHVLYFNNISLFSIMCLIQSVLNLGLEQLLWWLLLLFSSIQSWAIPMIFSLPLLQCFS